MRRLLIVDDEKNIRYGLKMMIEREFPDIYHIDLATQGQEALALYRAHPADIVITDIRMPVMDGIGLIEGIAAESRAIESGKPIIIILSGYDDFEYAKAAIRYQVKEYLLKPIRRDELFAVLRKSEEALIRQADLEQRIAASEAYLDHVKSSRLMGILMKEEASTQDVEELSQVIGMESVARPFRVAVMKYIYEDGNQMKSEDLKQLVKHTMEPNWSLVRACFFDGEGKLVLIGSLDSQFEDLSRQFTEKEMDGLMVGISREGYTADNLPECYQQAIIALSYTFIYPNVRRMSYGDIEGEARSYPMPDEEIRRLGNMLGTDREREMKALLLSIFHIEHMPHVQVDYLERVSKRMNEQVFDEVFRIYGESLVEVIKLYRKTGSLDNFRHFHDYFRSLEHLLLMVNDYVRSIRSAHSEHAEIKAAITYMEEHYNRPLNMAMVSNHVSLNYSYFSEAFKAHTGESFVVYLKKIRINKAKEMLRNHTLKLADIGNSVGFENAKQFTRVFKELEGIPPHEYRIKVLSDAEIRDV
ncbi:response regulator [Paenibacillus sp. GCM10028914]|uniref:response regulator n=1 Tax=Paenibacillus sp. GCM10028914 TaxID=3273416 RepID=UPI00361D73CA